MGGLEMDGQDAESILSEILEFLEAREGNSLKDSLAPKPEAAPDVAALVAEAPGAADESAPCPKCGKAPCECTQEG